MLVSVLSGYFLGGCLCGLSLSVWYFVCLVRHCRRSPWSYSLGVGWLLMILGTISANLVHLTLPGNYRWWDYWAVLTEIAPFFWWSTLILYWVMGKKQPAAASNQEQLLDPTAEDVWPPPPTSK